MLTVFDSQQNMGGIPANLYTVTGTHVAGQTILC